MRRTAGLVKRATYRDSVQLMRIARQLRDQPGIDQAEILMATESNLDALRRADLFPPELAQARLGASDLVIVVAGADEAVAHALRAAVERVDRGPLTLPSHEADEERAPRDRPVCRSLDEGLRRMCDANLALFSIPGSYVGSEAMRALEAGLNVMIFSSNVPVVDEVALKDEAARRGRLVMGPDCGTAFIGGAALGFANAIRRGKIGLVGAAGTGLQEVMTLIDRAGSGVSQAIGTGGRDVSEQVAGRSLLAGLALLDRDPSTEAIAVIGKPPSAVAAARVIEGIGRLQKPAVVCFLGTPPEPIARVGAVPAATLEDAAVQVVALVERRPTREVRATLLQDNAAVLRRTRDEAACPAGAEGCVRGLFCGGTLANEAALILLRAGGAVSANLTLPGVLPLDAEAGRRGHTVVDLGDEAFTRGRPHPMIEPAVREGPLLEAARDPATAVILLDFVLGHGSHPDPAGASLSALERTRAIAAERGRPLAILTSVCGTDRDPQGRTSQIQQLTNAGVIVAPTNAAAARAAAQIVGSRNAEKPPLPADRGAGRVRPTAPRPVQHGSLLDGVKVVNIGVLDFAEALWAQNVACVHIAWTPPSPEDAELADLLDRML